jgi:hypothetical protein
MACAANRALPLISRWRSLGEASRAIEQAHLIFKIVGNFSLHFGQ